MLVATLVAVGEGKLDQDVILRILVDRNRQKVPGQAPAKGLFLKGIGYSPHIIH